MGCYGCRPYRDFDYNRRRDRDIYCGSPYGPNCRGRRHYRNDFRPNPPRVLFFGFPRFF